MSKLLPWTALVFLAALLACQETAPAPPPTETPKPAAIAATPPPPANTHGPAQTTTAARAATPTSTPAPIPTVTSGPIPTPAPPRMLAPLETQDTQGMRSALSQAELDCIGGDHEKLAWTLAGPGTASIEEQAELIECLEDETLARIFLAGFVPGTEPLSLQSSTCVRAAFDVIDPRTVMTAGLKGNPGRAMAVSIAALTVTMACLTDEEWKEGASRWGRRPGERADMQCLMEALGGPREMAGVMRIAQAGHFTPLPSAAAECGLETGPVTDGGPVVFRPTLTATPETPTSAAIQTPTSDITPTTTLLPDLVIAIEARLKSNPHIEWGEGCIASSSSTLPFHVSEITAHVRNVGEGDAGSFTVQLNNAVAETVDGLKAGASTTVVLSERVRSENVAVVDAGSSIDESDESNNTAQTFMPVPTVAPPAPTCTPNSG